MERKFPLGEVARAGEVKVARSPRLAILVLASERTPWSRFQQVQRETWGSERSDDVAVFEFYKDISPGPVAQSISNAREWLRYGRKGVVQRWSDRSVSHRLHHSVPQVSVEGSAIRVPVPDLIHFNGQALIAALRWLRATQDFDYLFRVNSSAYVNVPVLRALLDELPATGILGGNVEPGASFWGFDFVNGAGMLMSRDLVTGISDAQDRWDHRLLDDVAVGRIARDLGMDVTPLPTPTINSDAQLAAIPKSVLRRSHHVRIRYRGRERNDERALRYIHGVVTGNDA